MISKDRLNELALEVWRSLESESACGESIVTDFAHALIKRIEQEAEVVGWLCNGSLYDVEQRRLSISGGGVFPNQTKLIALPLVDGE